MSEVDRFFLAVIQAGDELSIPIFGICKGKGGECRRSMWLLEARSVRISAPR